MPTAAGPMTGDGTGAATGGGVALIAMAFGLLPLINDRAIARDRAAGTSA